MKIKIKQYKIKNKTKFDILINMIYKIKEIEICLIHQNN